LPTDAEWEYACRAGTTSSWFFGDDAAALGQYAWFYENSGMTVHPVGEKVANPWGLYDMIGNVWEWCWDWYAPYEPAAVVDPIGPLESTDRALRGGSAWDDDAWFLRSTSRDGGVPESRDDFFGVRCVRCPHRSP
jgi:formylglycine-generating enzyme required for sulfatase activity